VSHRPRFTALVIALGFLTSLRALDSDRGFSGTWILDRASSDVRALAIDPDRMLTVVHGEKAMECSSTATDGSVARWSYALDRSETKYRLRGETMRSVAKWEGSAFLINTLVSGTHEYTVMDRWTLSRDGSALTIERQILRGAAESEAVLRYRREGAAAPASAPSATEPQALARRAEPAPAPAKDTVVTAGTKIPLVLLNSVDTKHSREGDRIYLTTAAPIALDNRIVIPRGSAVAGTVAHAKQQGRVAGKGELFLRFDSLTLPNGVTRDLRSRLGASDGTGHVDRKEGTITGEGDTAGNVKKIGIGTAAGAGAGSMAGHTVTGAGIGAAAGLAAVLLKRGPGAVLPKGTSVEMILDRDLRFTAEELRF